MSKSHRTDLEIIFDILEFCSEPRKQTRIMYRNNLNYNVLKNYLSKLSTLGLLCKNAPYYVTTEKGRQFVSHFEELENMLGNTTLTFTHDDSPTNRKLVINQQS